MNDRVWWLALAATVGGPVILTGVAVAVALSIERRRHRQRMWQIKADFCARMGWPPPPEE